MTDIGYKLKMINGDVFYIKANEDIDEVAMWVTKNSTGHGFTVAGDAYRLRRTAYIIDQGKSTPHLNLGLCNRNSITFPRRIAPRR